METKWYVFMVHGVHPMARDITALFYIAFEFPAAAD